MCVCVCVCVCLCVRRSTSPVSSSPQFWPIKSRSRELRCPTEHVMRPGGTLTDTSHTYINTSHYCLALAQLASAEEHSGARGGACRRTQRDLCMRSNKRRSRFGVWGCCVTAKKIALWLSGLPTCPASFSCRSRWRPAGARRSPPGRWCWCPGAAARAGPGTERGSAWPAWHSAAALSEAAAG